MCECEQQLLCQELLLICACKVDWLVCCGAKTAAFAAGTKMYMPITSHVPPRLTSTGMVYVSVCLWAARQQHRWH